VSFATVRRAWWVVGVWAVFQLTLTSLPGSELPAMPFSAADVVAHFGVYAVLGALVARAAALSGWPGARLPAVGLALSVLGALDEVHQQFIPGRGAQLVDWAADVGGVAAGLSLGTLVMRSRLAVWLR
jgi:VanZ family protein